MRKLETRTKIQLGGLVLKSGLTEFLDISPGDDLQLDLGIREKAHALLGMLKTVHEQAQEDPTALPYYAAKGKILANE
jgi:hypothetical protein